MRHLGSNEVRRYIRRGGCDRDHQTECAGSLSDRERAAAPTSKKRRSCRFRSDAHSRKRKALGAGDAGL